MFVVLFVTQQINAHEGRPVFVELKEKSSNQEPVSEPVYYQLQWKIPPVLANEQLPIISLQAEQCELLQRTQLFNIKPSLIGKKEYKCNGSIKDIAISINYPDANPALSSLIIIYDAAGNSKSIFSGPEQQLVQIPNKLSGFDVAKQYIEAGLKHIAFGYDHLLFVLCLMLIAVSVSRILITVTGFTIGHSVTLALSSYNLINIPVMFVELLIALSIVILAAEIIRSNQSRPNQANRRPSLTWRYPVIVATSFGLLHGLGFATVLNQLGLPQSHKLTAVLFFNLGIEIGQIMFISIILLMSLILVRLIQSKTVLNKMKMIGVFIIGILSSFWLFERLL